MSRLTLPRSWLVLVWIAGLPGCGRDTGEICLTGSASTVLQSAHAHNDYEHTCPLQDALSQGFTSVEVDVWYSGGEVQVAHDKKDFKGTLRDLYLTPLQARVDATGSVYGEGTPFFLWIDLKDSGSELRTTLHNLLDNFSMLSVFGTGSTTGPVTVIVTGDETIKRAFIAERATRRATRDSHRMDRDDPLDAEATWYSVKWTPHFGWTGIGRFPVSSSPFKSLIAQARTKNRRLRVFGAPDQPAFWKAMHDAGVDLISSDNLQGLATYLKKE